MYDAVTVSNIPSTAEMVAGYVDGNYANYSEMKSRFPDAIVVPITVFASDNEGTVLDVEQGDATPQESVGWVQKRRNAGVDPSVYCDTSNWANVRQAFQDAGVREPHYWIADWTGSPHIPDGAVACQYSSPGPYDVSEVADYWPGIDPAPHSGNGGEMFNESFDVGPNGGGITFARGAAKNVSFFVDNTLALGESNLGVDLRVVIWATDSAPDIQTVRVSNANSSQVTINFPNASMTHSVTVTRADSTTVTVHGEVSG